MTLRAIQPNPSYDMLLMSSQRSLMPKKRKSYWSVSEIGTSPLKVDVADDDADDGLVGIWKAPLPGGTAELKIHKKFKQHSINIKNYTAHPHDMVHVPAKFRENTSMSFWVTVRKLNVTDGRTDGGRCNISRPRPSAPREIKIMHK